MKRVALLAAPLLLGTSAVFAASADACLNCHEPDELKGVTAEDIAKSLADPDNRSHRRVRDLTAEDIEAILKELESG